jgi:hypothetical protein
LGIEEKGYFYGEKTVFKRGTGQGAKVSWKKPGI